MKTMFEAAIMRGNYDLDTMLRRITEYHISGDLTDAERSALTALARTGAKLPLDAGDEISRLWGTIRELTVRVAALEGSSGGDDGEWPAWRQPTGAHDAYYAGDRMTYTDGLLYTCIAPMGVACVWSPEIMPDYWKSA